MGAYNQKTDMSQNILREADRDFRNLEITNLQSELK